MNGFTPYLINEHIASLLLEADKARLARQATAGPSTPKRSWDAIRHSVARLVHRMEPALA